MEVIDIIPVVGIMFICYLVGMGLKAWDLFDDRKIPVMMGICGAILGVVVYFVERGLLGDGGIISAIVQGAFSGWAATGINQIVKQSGQKFAFKYTDETVDELTNGKDENE